MNGGNGLGFFALLICVIILAVLVLQKRRWFDPAVIIMVYWSILIFCVSLHLFGLQKVSDWGYIIFIIGLVSFCIGTSCSNLFTDKVSLDVKKKYVLDYRFLYVLYIIVIIFLLYNFRNVLELLGNGYSWAKIRRFYSNQGQSSGYNEVLQSAFNVMMNQFVSTPTVYASLPIAVSDMMIGKKDKKLFFMTIIMMFLWMMTSGGRSIVIWFAMYFVFAVLIVKKHKIRINKKILRIIRMALIPLMLVFIYITVERKGENLNILKEIYVYFPVGLKNFDYHIQEFTRSNSGYLWGVGSFYGFIYPVIFLLKQFGLMSYPDIILKARYLTFTSLEPNVFIGIDMNAYATFMYQPYLDGGLIGVAVILFAFGGLCGYYYHNVSKDMIQMKYLAIYLFLIQKLMFSQVRFYFTQTQQAIAMVILLFAFVNVNSFRRRLIFRFRRKES